MSNIERWITMGLAHGADPTRMLLPSGCTVTGERLSWEDTHGAAAACTREGRAILYLKLWPEIACKDMPYLTTDLWRALIKFEGRARQVAKTAKEAQARDQRQAAMVRTVLDEYQDPRLCLTCLRSRNPGHVMVQIEGKGMVWTLCPRCMGSMHRPWSDNRRAKAIGGDRNAYTTRIAPGYEHLLHRCTVLYREASKTFMQALFGGETPEGDDIERRLQARV